MHASEDPYNTKPLRLLTDSSAGGSFPGDTSPFRLLVYTCTYRAHTPTRNALMGPA